MNQCYISKNFDSQFEQIKFFLEKHDITFFSSNKIIKRDLSNNSILYIFQYCYNYEDFIDTMSTWNKPTKISPVVRTPMVTLTFPHKPTFEEAKRWLHINEDCTTPIGMGLLFIRILLGNKIDYDDFLHFYEKFLR